MSPLANFDKMSRSIYDRLHTVCCLFLLVPFGAVCSSERDVKDARYFRQEICDVVPRIQLGCFNRTSNPRGLIDCLTVCNDLNACIGAGVWRNDSSCHVHTPCPGMPTCGEGSDEYEYYSKNCDHRGTWNPETNSCACAGGWVGERCDRLPKDCDDLISYGYSNTLRVTLDLTDKNLPETEVFCLVNQDLPVPSSSILFMRNNGQVDNSELLAEYREGFESSASNLWLGLNRWRVLSNAGYNRMTFSASFSTTPETCTFTWRYENFQLEGVESNFTFSFQSATNETSGDCSAYTLGDCFGSLQNVSFSSEDWDNDVDDASNCALLHGSAWWYQGCHGPCNLMGWGQSHQGSKPSEMLIKLAGINSNEMLNRLNEVALTLEKSV